MSSLNGYFHLARAMLHRAAYSSTLRSLIAHGDAKRIARPLLGISAVHLSNLLNAEYTLPSEPLARRILQSLPLDSEQRDGLVEHFHMARMHQEHAARAWARPPVHSNPIPLFDQFHEAYGASLMERREDSRREALIVLAQFGKRLANRTDPRMAPLDYAQICLMLHNVQSILNRWDDALYYAWWAEYVLRELDGSGRREDPIRLEHLSMNALDAQIIAYRNLNQPRRSGRVAEQALEMLRTMNPAGQAFWKPHLLKDSIETIGRLPRFALGTVEGLADQARAVSDDALLSLMIDRGLLNAYNRYGSTRALKKAERLINVRLDALAHWPQVDPLRRTMFLFSAARFYWSRGQYEAWEATAGEAARLASALGLRHQLAEARRSFGEALNRLAAD